jgi:hypothetical protein
MRNCLSVKYPFGLSRTQFFSFVLGASIGSALIFVVYLYITYTQVSIFEEWYFIYPSGFVFSGTLGFYLASVWGEQDDAMLFLFGLLSIPMLFLITVAYKDLYQDVTIFIGFLVGFSLVMSGVIKKQLDIWKFAEKFYKKLSWYFFGTGLTASFELPIVQKIISFKATNIISLSLLVLIAVAFSFYLFLIHKYIDTASSH